MRWIRDHKLVSFLILTIIVALGFIVFAAVTGGEEVHSSRVTGTVFGKISQPFATAGRKISGTVTGVFSYKDIAKENQQLKKENEKLRAEIRKTRIDNQDMDQLKDLKKVFNYQKIVQSDSIVTADVVGMDGTNWMNIFTIGAGSEAGIKKGNVVVSGGGLVGTVISSGSHWSKVRTIMDKSSKMSFRVDKNPDIIGILKVSDDGRLQGYTLNSEAAIVEGNTLVTSGMGEYPKGIPIGKIMRIRYDSNDQLQRVTVKPAVEFAGIQKVSVLQ